MSKEEEVVHCEECCYWNYNLTGNSFGKCCISGLSTPMHGYCFQGKNINKHLTCQGCKHNIIVNGCQVCWFSFSLKDGDGDVYTLRSVTNDTKRCDHYERLR